MSAKLLPPGLTPTGTYQLISLRTAQVGVILPLNCFNFSAHRQRMGKGLVGIVLFGLRIFKRLKAKHFVDAICLSARPIILTFVRSLELMRTKLEALASLSALKVRLNPSVLRTFHFLQLSNGNRGIWQTKGPSEVKKPAYVTVCNYLTIKRITAAVCQQYGLDVLFNFTANLKQLLGCEQISILSGINFQHTWIVSPL